LKRPELIPLTQFYIGVDSGFGSSAFAIVLLTVMDDKIRVLETKEIYREQFDFCINQVSNIMLKYGLNTYNTKILVDAALSLLNYRKKNKLRDVYFDMVVIPVNFNIATKKEMLLNLSCWMQE